ncbi:MAG: IS66 family insertion sequence element accessory protein TnpB [Oribacterium sp.]|nr:IS66 family insertion sequence element accessory protein TnpB [Oribacterium sp.]
MSNLKHQPRRSDAEWYRIIMDCRKSGLSDTKWCQLHDISPSTFFSAVKRLRGNSFSIPERTADDIYDLTIPKQDVVRVDIVPDVQPPREVISPEAAPHIDNSHMIEITMGDIHVSLCNGADPVLVSKTLSLLRSYS